MKIFIDIDDTLFQTSSVMKSNSVAHILLAEIEAPLFEGAKETIEQFFKRKYESFAVTKRGFISSDEIPITKQRLIETGLIAKDSDTLILGFLAYAKNKYKAIEKIYKEYFKMNVEKDKTILIDNDLEQIIMCAMNGISTILFAPELKEISLETQETINKFNITVAHSWEDIREIVINKELGEQEKE